THRPTGAPRPLLSRSGLGAGRKTRGFGPGLPDAAPPGRKQQASELSVTLSAERGNEEVANLRNRKVPPRGRAGWMARPLISSCPGPKLDFVVAREGRPSVTKAPAAQ